MKHKILTLILLVIPATIMAQKITLGSCVTKDGGQYKGEMVGTGIVCNQGWRTV